MSINVCPICGRLEPDHDLEKHKALHDQASGRARERSAGDASAPQREVRAPRDPVLRALLIRKGVISADELAKAEDELRSTGALLA